MSRPIGLWAKQLNGTLLATLAALIIALQDGRVEVVEWLAVAGTLVAEFVAITFIRNAAAGWRRYARALGGGVVAFLGALATGTSDGWPPDSYQLAIAFAALLNALPIAWSSNAAVSDPVEFRGRV